MLRTLAMKTLCSWRYQTAGKRGMVQNKWQGWSRSFDFR